MKKYISGLLLWKNPYEELEEFKKLAGYASEYHHVDKKRIINFLIECDIGKENFLEMWDLCSYDFSRFLLCMWKYEAVLIKKEDILINILNKNKDFFTKG